MFTVASRSVPSLTMVKMTKLYAGSRDKDTVKYGDVVTTVKNRFLAQQRVHKDKLGQVSYLVI